MASKNTEKQTAKENAVATKKNSAVKKTAAVVRVPQVDTPRLNKKDTHRDSKKDIKKNSPQNSIAADHQKDKKNKSSFLLIFLLAVLFFGIYYYISSRSFKEEVEQLSPTPELTTNENEKSAQERREKEVQRLSSELAKYISDQVQETLKKFDEKENSPEFRKCLLLLKKDSNINKEESELNKKNNRVKKEVSNQNKKVLLDFEKEKKGCRESLVANAKSLQAKFEVDLEILLRSIANEKLEIFKKEALILHENCQKDLANLIKKANDSYDKSIAKIKNEAEKIENFNKFQKDQEETKRTVKRFCNYAEGKTKETLAKINRDFAEGIKKTTTAEDFLKHKEIIYSSELRKFKLLDKVNSYHNDLKKSFQKDLDDLLKKENSDDFEKKIKELFESYRKKLSDFSKEAIDENYKIIKIMRKNIIQAEELAAQAGDDGEDISDEPWTYSFLVSIGMGFECVLVALVIWILMRFLNIDPGMTLFIVGFYVVFLFDFFLLAIKKYGKKNYIERLFDMFSKHFWPKIIIIVILFFIFMWLFDSDRNNLCDCSV